MTPKQEDKVIKMTKARRYSSSTFKIDKHKGLYFIISNKQGQCSSFSK